MTWDYLLECSNEWPSHWLCVEDFEVLIIRQLLGVKVFEERLP